MALTFAEKLLELMRKQGWSVNDLARESGLSFPTVRSYTAKGIMNRKPTLVNTIRIAKALNVSMDEFKDCTDLQLTKGEKSRGAKKPKEDSDSDES